MYLNRVIVGGMTLLLYVLVVLHWSYSMVVLKLTGVGLKRLPIRLVWFSRAF